jgi:RNA polymerase sigma-70 factor, ECF subfamily
VSFAVDDVVLEASGYRRELTAYCYRMLGSASEAEDAVQETLVRAWRGADDFDGRSALRSWLYRIATNVCIDMTRAPQRRALPMDLGGPGAVGETTDIGAPLGSHRWIEPISDTKVLPGPGDNADPSDVAVLRDSVRLAFVAALARLPAQQRAVLVLREVLQWSATEVAELLGVSVDAVTSALARARATMRAVSAETAGRQLDDQDRSLLDSYVAAFQAYDVSALVGLLQRDATFTMPPFAFWLRGVDDIQRWWDGPGRVCAGSRILLTRANGGPAVAVYHPVGDTRWEPFAIHVLEVRDGRIAGICHFLDVSLFGEFDLPELLTS